MQAEPLRKEAVQKQPFFLKIRIQQSIKVYQRFVPLAPSVKAQPVFVCQEFKQAWKMQSETKHHSL